MISKPCGNAGLFACKTWRGRVVCAKTFNMNKRSFVGLKAGDIHAICTALGIKYRPGGAAQYHLESGRKDRFMLSDGYDDRVLISPEGFFFYSTSPIRFQLFDKEKHAAVMEVLRDLDFNLSALENLIATRASMPDGLVYLTSAFPMTAEEKKPYEEDGWIFETRNLPYFKGVVDEVLYSAV